MMEEMRALMRIRSVVSLRTSLTMRQTRIRRRKLTAGISACAHDCTRKNAHMWRRLVSIQRAII